MVPLPRQRRTHLSPSDPLFISRVLDGEHNRVILNFFFAPGIRLCAPHVRQAWRRWLSVLQLGVLKLAGGVAEWVLRYSGDR